MLSTSLLATVASYLGPTAGWVLFVVMLLLRLFAPNQSLLSAAKIHHELKQARRKDGVKAVLDAQGTIEKLRTAGLPLDEFNLYKDRILDLAGLRQTKNENNPVDTAVRKEDVFFDQIENSAVTNRRILLQALTFSTISIVAVVCTNWYMGYVESVDFAGVSFAILYKNGSISYYSFPFNDIIPITIGTFIALRLFTPKGSLLIQSVLASVVSTMLTVTFIPI